jgi:DNA polymerase I
MSKKLYIIDGHAHIYAAYYAPIGKGLKSPGGEPTKATYIFTQAILGLIERKKPDMLVMTMDSKTPTFRSKIYTDYKAHRPPMPEDMPVQISRIEQIIEAMNIPILRVEGYEADDIIGTLSKKAAAAGFESFLCSKDKDLLQLIDENISTYDIKTDTATNEAAFFQQMGIKPVQFIDVLALQGDASDNVPGVPDVGPKTALEWIQKYGSIENLYEHVDQIKGKRGENLTKFKDLAMLSRELVTLNCNVPGLDNFQFQISNPEMQIDKLVSIFDELGFDSLKVKISNRKSTGKTVAAKIPKLIPDAQQPSTGDYRLIDSPEKFDDFLAELKKQKLFAIDTETTSIFAMRAELVGISFSWQSCIGFYLPVKGPLGAKHLDINRVRAALAPILANESIKKIGQNIKYDMLVLQNAQMPVKGVFFDTMVASYCLDQERSHSMDAMAKDFLHYDCIPISDLIGKGRNQLTFDMVDTAVACKYSAEDADITFRLYLYFKQRLDAEPMLRQLFEQLEMPLVPVLAAMEYNGVGLDTALLRKLSNEITTALDNVTGQIYQQTGQTFNIDSPKQLADVLFKKLNLPAVRLTKSGLSTDAAVLEELKDKHPVVERILEYRTLGKLKNTYVDKLGTLINPRTGRVHTQFNQTITATGRLSSSDPNLQNIPIRTELGSKIRHAFIPKNSGDCILSADYSQIELRLLAHFSQDKQMLAAFAADEDIHRFVASQIFNCPLSEVTSEMRSRCKAVNFGIIYGQGAFGLSKSIGISRTEAKQFIDDYFRRYSSIRDFMDECIRLAKQNGYAETILHRRRTIEDLSSKNGGKRSQAERLAVNTVIQGSAADLIKVAMINIQRKIEQENLPVKMILQVHDELVFELPATQAAQHSQWIQKQMTDAIKLDVMMKVDSTIGPTW